MSDHESDTGSAARSHSVRRRDVLRRTGAVAGVLTMAGQVAAGPGNGPPRNSAFKAGAASTSIAPLPNHLEAGVYLAGFGIGPQPSRRAQGIHDGSRARALSVAAGGETVVVVRLDLLGLGNRQIDAIRNQASEMTDVKRENIIVGNTHTHSGPDFQGLWGGVPAAYRDYVVTNTVEAIERAIADRQPASIAVGATKAPDLASNRRGWDSTDDTLTVLRVTAKNGDDAISTLVNYAAHPVLIGSGNQLVATDFVGPLERSVEASHGGLAIYVNGAIGDASPMRPDVDGEYERAERYGELLAARVDDALGSAETIKPILEIRQAAVRLPIDNCAFKAGFESGLMRPYYHGESVAGTATSGAARLLEGVSEAAGDAVRTAANTTPAAGALAIHSPISRIRLGVDPTIELFSIPGEAVTHLGKELRGIAGGDYQVPLGLSQNSLGYIIPQNEWQTGRNDNYEETVSLGPDTAPIYRKGVLSLYDKRTSPGYPRTQDDSRVCPDEQARFDNQFGGTFTQANVR